MALIRYGGMVADASGSIGGVTFARNRGGAYARNRTSPLNPNSPDQVRVRATFGDLATRFATVLTQSQRDAWNAFGNTVPVQNPLGEERFLTGLQMYQRSNTLLVQCGAAAVDEPPASFTAGPTLEPTYTVDAAADTFTVTNLGGYDPTTDGPIGLYFSAGRPVNPGVNYYRSPFRLAAASIYVSLAGLPTDVALPSPVQVGQVLFLRCRPVLPDGRVGGEVITRFPVA